MVDVFTRPFPSTRKAVIIIAVSAFLVTAVFQTVTWGEMVMVDSSIWGHQAEYFLGNNPKQFDYLLAYGHPGGTIIEGAILIHWLFGLSFETAVIVFTIVCSSLFVALICVFTILLKKDRLWWAGVLPVLALSWLYSSATPPSAIASVAVAFLCLFALYLYEKREVKTRDVLWWGILSGFLVATRFDIGVVMSAVFAGLLLSRAGWRESSIIFGAALASFLVFDPYMWFMPVQHLRDLVFKITYHYADIAPYDLSFNTVLGFSFLSGISMLLATYFLIRRKKETPPLPPIFIGALMLVTAVLYVVFLTARSQATRYFLPILFIWEIFFPLFMFTLSERMPHQSKIRARRYVIVLLFLYNFVPLIISLLISQFFGLIPT